jgi:hypothetical protein
MNDLKFAIKWALIIAFCLFSTFAAYLYWNVDKQNFAFPGAGRLDFTIHLAGDYSLHRTSGVEAFITPEAYNDGTPTIPTCVVECATDGRYILAIRQDPDKLTDSSSKDGTPVIQDYWILDTQKLEVHGPLNEETFQKLREKLSIAQNIQLRPIGNFRPERPGL